MRSPRSVRSITAVALAVLAAITVTGLAGSPAAPPTPLRAADADRTLATAVDRTVAAGSARVQGTMTTPDGTTGRLAGVASFRHRTSAFVVHAAGAGPGAGAEIRTTPQGTWLRPPGRSAWVAVEGAVAVVSAGGHQWSDLLERLRGTTDVEWVVGGATGRLRGTLGLQEVTIALDDAGRIEHLRLEGGGAVLDLRLTELGVAVAVVAPEGAAP